MNEKREFIRFLSRPLKFHVNRNGTMERGRERERKKKETLKNRQLETGQTAACSRCKIIQREFNSFLRVCIFLSSLSFSNYTALTRNYTTRVKKERKERKKHRGWKEKADKQSSRVSLFSQDFPNVKRLSSTRLTIRVFLHINPS